MVVVVVVVVVVVAAVAVAVSTVQNSGRYMIIGYLDP